MKKGLFILIGMFVLGLFLINFVSAGYCLGNVECVFFTETECNEVYDEYGFCEWDDGDYECYSGMMNQGSCSYFNYDEASCMDLDGLLEYQESGCTWEPGCLVDYDCASGEGCDGEIESCAGTYYTDPKLYWDGFTPWNWVANAYYTVIGIDAEGVEMTVTNIGCDACSQGGLDSYKVTGSSWYKYDCWKPTICIFGNSMEWVSLGYVNPAYTSASCSGFSQYNCGTESGCYWDINYGTCVDPDDSEEVCTDDGYDWEQPMSWLCPGCGYPEEGECCGDDGASDIGQILVYGGSSYPSYTYTCKICEATVSFGGVEYYTAGEYTWVPTFDLADTNPPPITQAFFGYMTGFDDDCDGLVDEDVVGITCEECQSTGGEWCVGSTHSPTTFCANTQAECNSYTGTIQPSCCIPTQTCATEGFECGAFVDDCSNFQTCGSSCSIAGEFCISGTCTLLDDCGACVDAGLSWCDNNHCSAEFLTGVCVQTCPCVPDATCESYEMECGSFVDSCEYPQNCGTCDDPIICESGTELLIPMCEEGECVDFIQACAAGEICSNGECVLAPVVYWADEVGDELNPPEIDPLPISPGTTPVNLVVENSNFPSGTTVYFWIYEDDGLTGDDSIRTEGNALIGHVDANGVATPDNAWVITENDLIAGSSQFLDKESDIYDVFEFYFELNDDNDLRSEILYSRYIAGLCTEKTSCRDFTGGLVECNNAELSCPGVAANSVPEGVDCEGDNCYCQWVGDYCESGVKGDTGNCTFIENPSLDTNGCDDGWLTYGWVGTWEYNPGYSEANDPEGEKTSCETAGTETVPCPAQIELPFFGTWGIVITIALIVLIYVALNLRKHKSKPKKRKKKKE